MSAIQLSEQHDGLPRGGPEEYGVDSRVVLAFLDELSTRSVELHAFMLARRGHVVASGSWWPYRLDRPHMQHSLTKSLTACGVGLAIAERRLMLDDPVISFFNDERPKSVDPSLASMTVRDLLTMQTGHAEGVSGAAWRGIPTSWIAEFFKIPIVHRPGSTFVYSSAASFMLSAIVTKTTGVSLREYLEPRLLAPLGITDVRWDIGPGGINPGGNGLSWTTADSLKLGILHAQRGQWQGRQILPAEWVDESTRSQVASGKYGFHWWIGPGKAYYASGAFSQYSIIFPEHEAVLAIAAGSVDPDLMSIVWRHFPLAFDPDPVSMNDSAQSALQERCEGLRLLPPLVATESPLARHVSGRTYEMEANEDDVESIRFEFGSGRCVFYLNDARGRHRVDVGLSDWNEGETSMTVNKLHHAYQPDVMRVVAGGRWLTADTFEMIWQFVESAFQDRVLCHFTGDNMTLARRVNVNMAATSRPTLRGRTSPRRASST